MRRVNVCAVWYQVSVWREQNTLRPLDSVMPAKAGTHVFRPSRSRKSWIPACAGMTEKGHAESPGMTKKGHAESPGMTEKGLAESQSAPSGISRRV